MPNFRYKAVDDNGRLVRGVITAFSDADIERDLNQRGLALIKLSTVREHFTAKWFGGKVKPRVLIEFYRRFAQTLEMGLPILSGLEENARFLPSQALKKILGEIRVAVEGGRSLHEAMGRFPRVFQPLDLAIVRMGEQSGVLPKCLDDLAAFHEWKADIRAVFKKATIYPAFILLAIVAVLGVWVGYVLPQMVTVLSEMGITLPRVTMAVLSASNFITSHWLWLIGCGLAALAALALFQKTERGGQISHRYLLKMPILGDILGNIAITRLCHNFATMFTAGMNINTIFNTLGAKTLGNRFIEQQLRRVHREIERGESIAGGFEKTQGFPPLLVGALRNGEATGKIDEAFSRLGHYYDGEVKRTVQALVNAIEPITIIMLGGVFGLIVLSILLPLYDVLGEFGKAY